MNEIAYSIVEQWQLINPDKRANFNSIRVKHAEPKLGFYTIYFNANNVMQRIKAWKIGSTWKLTYLI